jgi:hypothetical protein
LVQTNGKWRFDAGAGSQEILARKIGENETTVMHVCQALANATQQDTKAGSADPIQQFAQAIVNGGQAKPISGPFHGYYFRVVAQEPVGVVLVAYPAEYRATGVMTFVVVNGGNVYERDLGPETEYLAPRIQGKPSGKWHRVQVSQTTQPSQEEWTRCLQNDGCHVEDLFMDQWDWRFGSE